MKKIFILGFTILCFGISGYAETKIADLDKLVAEGKGEKIAEGVYQLKDKVVINGNEQAKSEYGYLVASPNARYFLLIDSIVAPKFMRIGKFLDENGKLIWERQNLGDTSRRIVSNRGFVALFYGEFNVIAIELIDKANRTIKLIERDSTVSDDVVDGFASEDSQFAKDSDILFFPLFLKKEGLALVGINSKGELIYNEKINPNIKAVDKFWGRVYYNSSQNAVLIDSNGIGDDSPAISYWTFPQRKVFSQKMGSGETALNAMFVDEDILLLVKNKNGMKGIKRINNKGKEKGYKADVSKMDKAEIQLFKEKSLRVESLQWGQE